MQNYETAFRRELPVHSLGWASSMRSEESVKYRVAAHLEVRGEAHSHSVCCSSVALIPGSMHVESVCLAHRCVAETYACKTSMLIL